jgi:hypothetical protein
VSEQVARTDLVSSLRKQGPILRADDVLGDVDIPVAPLLACASARAYGSLLSQGRRKRKSRHCSNFCKHESAISPRVSHEFCCRCPALFDQRAPCCPRGRRECRAPGAPAASCAKKSTRVRNHGHAGITRHSPRNGFNGFLRALPGDRALLSPSPPRSLLLKSLTPASGRQNHTTSPSAMLKRLRQCAACVHRIPRQRL